MWQKFKRWLIRKLGGSYEDPRLLDFHITRTIAPVTTLSVSYAVDMDWWDSNMEYIKHNELIPLLAEKMITEGFVDIIFCGVSSDNQGLFRAECKVVDVRGKNK